MTDIQTRLFELRDEKYRDFNSKLIPSVQPERVIGVRTPALRALAKELRGTEAAESFLRALPHKYFEENQLHAFLLDGVKDYEKCTEALDDFLPYVDNWATCDQLSPSVLGRNKNKLLTKIREWIASEHVYTARFAIGQLMRWYLDDDFKTEYADMVCAVRSEEYYLRMMQAWYFATALAKHYELILPYIEARRLERWTHNKAIQKAIESYRVTSEHKTQLRALKIK